MRHIFVALAAAVVTPSISFSQAIPMYVDGTVMGGLDDGSSWANAFSSLDRALDPTVNTTLVNNAVELRLHDGQTYRPDGTHKYPSGSPDMRSWTFFMTANASIRGGWNGTEMNDTPLGNPQSTTLSGDRLNNGVSSTFSYHVVVPQHNNLGSVEQFISRVKIRDGNANGFVAGSTSQYGGGVLCDGAHVFFDEIVFRDNFALYGGALAIQAYSQAGHHSSIKMKRTKFISNLAAQKGGALYAIVTGATELANCTFKNNGGSVLRGGAIALDVQVHDTRITNCRIFDNTATLEGGGVWAAWPECGNCGYEINHCTIAFNSASEGKGDGMFVQSGSGSITFNVQNSIIWKNGANDDNLYVEFAGNPFDVTHSCIGPRDPGMLGTLTTSGNGFLDSVDPLFVSEANRNFRLQILSPCVNAGHDGLLAVDFTDIDGDGFFDPVLPRDFYLLDEEWIPDTATTREVLEGPFSSFGIDANTPGVCDIGAYEYRTYSGPQ